MISMKNRKNLFPSAEGVLSIPLSSINFASAIKLIKCGKAQIPDNFPPDIFWSTVVQKCYMTSKILHSLPEVPNNAHNMATVHSYLVTKTWQSSWWLKDLPAHIAVERFLQAFKAITLGASRTCSSPQLPNKPDGFRHSQCTTDQEFKLTYDVERHFEENNKLGIVLANLAATHDGLLYGTRAEHPTTCFELLLHL